MKILATFTPEPFFGEIRPIRNNTDLINVILDKMLGLEVLEDSEIDPNKPDEYSENQLLDVIKHYDCITRHTEIKLVSTAKELLELCSADRFQKVANSFIDTHKIS